jgi:aminoglycoside phosphotransferase (APT) family kinase protein
MKTCDPKYERYIPDLIRRATGASPTRLIPVPTVPDTIVYEAELPTGSVIFKAIDADGRDPDGIGLEAWMCETVRSLGVPAPQVLAVDTSRGLLPSSYFIMQKAGGQPLSTLPAARQRMFLHKIGGYLRQLHTLQLQGFGWLDEQHYRQHGAIRGSDPIWRDAVLKDIAASLAYFQRTGTLEAQFILKIERILELADPVLHAVTIGQLLHGDVGELHVWVDPNRGDVTSFVDFGERSAGDPIWDMLQFDWAGVPLLVEGYELDQPARERFRPTFQLYGVLQAVPWARKWHARGGVHTVEWLKTTIREATPVLGLASTFD